MTKPSPAANAIKDGKTEVIVLPMKERPLFPGFYRAVRVFGFTFNSQLHSFLLIVFVFIYVLIFMTISLFS